MMSVPESRSTLTPASALRNGPPTLMHALRARATESPAGLALLRKRHGIWETTTWSELNARVERLAGALRERGLGPGSSVVIVGDATPEWLILDLAVQGLGALSIGFYPEQARRDIASAAGDLTVDVLAGGDDEQLGRARDALPSARLQFLLDARSLRSAKGSAVELVNELSATGSVPALEPDPTRETVGLVTAGTSGPSRLVLITQGEAVTLARRAADWLGLTSSDRNLCHVPGGLPAARLLDLYAPICAGSTIAFPESPQTIVENLVELQPTVLTTTPRALELLAGESELRVAQAHRVKSAANRWARRARERAGAPGGASRPTLAHYLVDRPIVRQLGLGETRRVVCAGAPLARRLLDYYWSLRVPAVETYGQPETFGLAFAQRGPQDRGTIGPPLPGLQPRIEEGMLRLRLARPDEEEWLRTEDFATLDGEGRLVLAGGVTDVSIGPDGTQLVLSRIESNLRLSRYVREAVVLPTAAGGLHALVEFDFDAVSGWLSQNGHAVSPYDVLAHDPAVIGVIDEAVQSANANLSEPERITAFRLLERPLSLDELEVSPNRRVRRAGVERSFAAELSEMDAVTPTRRP
jgi:long-chain acyl-CoA synthetase